jgi:hypothetical protein
MIGEREKYTHRILMIVKELKDEYSKVRKKLIRIVKSLD